MSGFFGVASQGDCVTDLFYGTDYQSHLGTRRGGMAVSNGQGIQRIIHDISTSQFRSKFQTDVLGMKGHLGIGVISDYEDQPLIIGSHPDVLTTAGSRTRSRRAFSRRTACRPWRPFAKRSRRRARGTRCPCPGSRTR